MRLTYKQKFFKLQAEARARKLKVRVIGKRRLIDYRAMNDLAARIFGVKSYPVRTIELERGPYKQMAKDLKHEIVERNRISKGSKYWAAHLAGRRAERAV